MTTESCKNGAITITSPRMNVTGYVGDATVFSWVFTISSCLVVGLG